jgi:diguanylate cyclase (GGDEF)-like protein
MALNVMGVLSGLTMVVAVVLGLQSAEANAHDLRRRALPAVAALQQTESARALARNSFLESLELEHSAAKDEALLRAQAAAASQDGAWTAYRQLSLDGVDEQALQLSYEASVVESRHLALSVMSLRLDDPSRGAVLTAERIEANNQAVTLSDLRESIYEPLVRREAAAVADGVRRGRMAAIVSYGILAILFSIAGSMLVFAARRDEQKFHDETAALRAIGQQANFEGALQRGLEMAPSEDAAFAVVSQAVSMVADDVPTEMLIADSSQAHFRQVVMAGPASGTGCRVGGPSDCPAAKSGQSRIFDDTTLLDTCRFLRGHDEPAWATCVPVSIAGRTVGVIHAQRSLDHGPPGQLQSGLELVARKAGERISFLRVLADTEFQAQVDPLTGLPNRRTLEGQVHDLITPDEPYVVAFVDLDHFKSINDTHGHETGDRALRLFARVLRDSIRPRDLLARYGGEEFVVVLPNCSPAEARLVAERVRSALAAALGNGSVPPFTVTVGLAGSEDGEGFADVVTRADITMLSAKSAGRDRVVVAGSSPPPEADDHPSCERSIEPLFEHLLEVGSPVRPSA